MRYLKPSNVDIYEPVRDENDIRIKNIIRNYKEDEECNIGIIGVPFDYGVELSNGRVGAKEGPNAVRTALKRYGSIYNVEKNINISDLKICDFGDVEVVERDSQETHARVSETVFELVKKDVLPIVIGGGHDISFANVRGLCNAFDGKIGGINIDAHFDVRIVKNGKNSSGTSFRRVLEELDGKVLGKNFVEIGCHDNLNSKTYYEYLLAKKSNIITLSEVQKKRMKKIMVGALKIANAATKASFVSVDIDAMPQHVAPGCSAPSARGIQAHDILEACFIAGVNSKVKLFDIMELNPRYDVDNRTALLAATMIVSFLEGFAMRNKSK